MSGVSLNTQPAYHELNENFKIPSPVTTVILPAREIAIVGEQKWKENFFVQKGTDPGPKEHNPYASLYEETSRKARELKIDLDGPEAKLVSKAISEISAQLYPENPYTPPAEVVLQAAKIVYTSAQNEITQRETAKSLNTFSELNSLAQQIYGIKS